MPIRCWRTTIRQGRVAAGAPSADVNDVTVRSTLLRDNAQPLGIGFNVHLVDTEWKVYDISVEAISLVTNFRSQINAEIKKSSLNDVIARMEKARLLRRQNPTQVQTDDMAALTGELSFASVPAALDQADALMRMADRSVGCDPNRQRRPRTAAGVDPPRARHRKAIATGRSRKAGARPGQVLETGCRAHLRGIQMNSRIERCGVAFGISLLVCGCAHTPADDPSDPLEPVNRAMFTFNRTADRYLLRPVAKVTSRSCLISRGRASAISSRICTTRR